MFFYCICAESQDGFVHVRKGANEWTCVCVCVCLASRILRMRASLVIAASTISAHSHSHPVLSVSHTQPLNGWKLGCHNNRISNAGFLKLCGALYRQCVVLQSERYRATERRGREGGIETKRERTVVRERERCEREGRRLRESRGDCERQREERRGKESTGSATPVLWILVSWDRFAVRPGGKALNM